VAKKRTKQEADQYKNNDVIMRTIYSAQFNLFVRVVDCVHIAIKRDEYSVRPYGTVGIVMQVLYQIFIFRKTMNQLLTVEDESNRDYRRFNMVGTELTVRLAPPHEQDGIDPVAHSLESMTENFEYALRNSNDSDMVGISIHNEMNQNDKPIGSSFRRKDQLSGDVVWSVLGKVTQ
jgi:hypothetical protein